MRNTILSVIKRLVYLFTWALCCCALNAEELPLSQAVDLALKHNLDIANTLLDVSKTKDRFAAFHTTLLPNFRFYALGAEQLNNFSITVPAGSLGTYKGIGPVPDTDVHYSTPMQPTGLIIGRVAQPLSGIYRTRLNLKVLSFSTQLAEQKARGKRQDIVRDVKQLYYGIEQVESALQVTRDTITLYKEVERLTTNYVEQQTALPAQLLQAQANLAQSEQSELTLSNQEAKQKEQLNDLMGRDVLIDFSVTSMEEAADTTMDIAAARKQALSARPELQQAHLKVLQSTEDIRAKKAEYIPDFSVEFNTLTLLNYNSFLPGGSYSVGFSLSWEPFDWGRKKDELAEKKDTLLQDKNTETSTARKVIMDVDDKYRAMQQNWAKLRVASLSQKVAEENLRVDKNQYEVQSALLQVVLQAQAALGQANSDYQKALADYWTSKADLEHALGNDQ